MKNKIGDYFRKIPMDFPAPDRIGEFEYKRLVEQNLNLMKINSFVAVKYNETYSLTATFDINRNTLMSYLDEWNNEENDPEVHWGEKIKNNKGSSVAYIKGKMDENSESILYAEMGNDLEENKNKTEALNMVRNCITQKREDYVYKYSKEENMRRIKESGRGVFNEGARTLDEFLQAIWEQRLLGTLCECDILLEVLNAVRYYTTDENSYVSIYNAKWDDDMKTLYEDARDKFRNRSKKYYPIKLEEINRRDGEKGGNPAYMRDFAPNTVRAFVLNSEFRKLYKDVNDTRKYDWEEMKNLKKLFYEYTKLTPEDINIDDIWLYEKLTGINTSIEISLLMDLLLDGRDLKVEGNVKKLMQELVKEVMAWPGSYSRKEIIHILIFLAKSIKDEGGAIEIELFLKYSIKFLREKMPIVTEKYDYILYLIWQNFRGSNLNKFNWLDTYCRNFLNDNKIGLDDVGCICNRQEDIILVAMGENEISFQVLDKADGIEGNSFGVPGNSAWFQAIQKEVIMNR